MSSWVPKDSLAAHWGTEPMPLCCPAGSLRWLRFFLDDDAELQKIEEPSPEGCFKFGQWQLKVLTVTSMLLKVNSKMYTVSIASFGFMPSSYPEFHGHIRHITNLFPQEQYGSGQGEDYWSTGQAWPYLCQIHDTQPVLARVLQGF